MSCIAPSTFFNLLGDYGKTSINQFYDLMKNLQLYGITCMNYEIATKRTKDVKDTKVKLYVPWDMAAHVTNLHLVEIQTWKLKLSVSLKHETGLGKAGKELLK